MNPTLTMHFDGSCLRNPGGPGGWGFVVHQGVHAIYADHGHISPSELTTNNVAEYLGLIEGVKYLNREFPEHPVLILGDSQIVIRRINKHTRPGKSHLIPLWQEAVLLLHSHIGSIELRWIPREENEVADAEAFLGLYYESRLDGTEHLNLLDAQ